MKYSDLVRKIRQAAAAQDIDCGLVRQGGQHEIWRCGGLEVAIPRHRNINDYTAQGILRHLERELGKDWWRQ